MPATNHKMTGKRWLTGAAGALAVYIASYGWFFSHRGPAANLAYFAYFPDATAVPAGAEEAAYYGFFPVYKMHRLLGGPPHNFDRGTPAAPPDDFKG